MSNAENGLATWSLQAFVDHFMSCHSRGGSAFCFVLGSGASRTSGIPTGIELVDLWLEELKSRDPLSSVLSLSEWASAERLNALGGDEKYIPDEFQWESRASYYSHIYDLRFAHSPFDGYAYFEDLIEGTAPSVGYVILSKILDSTDHNVVLTTNFDNLVADALALTSNRAPIVVAHESLTEFIPKRIRRPLIAKVHRDVFFAPKNRPAELATVDRSWRSGLAQILDNYIPLEPIRKPA